MVELLGDLQLDGPVAQRAEIQVLEGTLWRPQGSERVKVVRPENARLAITGGRGLRDRGPNDDLMSAKPREATWLPQGTWQLEADPDQSGGLLMPCVLF